MAATLFHVAVDPIRRRKMKMPTVRQLFGRAGAMAFPHVLGELIRAQQLMAMGVRQRRMRQRRQQECNEGESSTATHEAPNQGKE